MILTFSREVRESVLAKAMAGIVVLVVVTVISSVLTTEEVAIRREEVDGVLHLVVQTMT